MYHSVQLMPGYGAPVGSTLRIVLYPGVWENMIRALSAASATVWASTLVEYSALYVTRKRGAQALANATVRSKSDIFAHWVTPGGPYACARAL